MVRFKAQIAGDSGSIGKVCNAEAAHLDRWIAAHDSIRASLVESCDAHSLTPPGGIPRMPASFGAIAQLGERNTGSVEVGGSIPPGSTKNPGFRRAWFNPMRFWNTG